jgi:hypothetical protein
MLLLIYALIDANVISRSVGRAETSQARPRFMGLLALGAFRNYGIDPHC